MHKQIGMCMHKGKHHSKDLCEHAIICHSRRVMLTACLTSHLQDFHKCFSKHIFEGVCIHILILHRTAHGESQVHVTVLFRSQNACIWNKQKRLKCYSAKVSSVSYLFILLVTSSPLLRNLAVKIWQMLVRSWRKMGGLPSEMGLCNLSEVAKRRLLQTHLLITSFPQGSLN